jgi:hypothetical protein
MTYTREQIAAAVKAKEYAWFENGDLNLNIVGLETLLQIQRLLIFLMIV